MCAPRSVWHNEDSLFSDQDMRSLQSVQLLFCILHMCAQVESSMAVQSLKPRIDMMKARYGDDQAKIKRETNFLYEQAGVNPLAGGATVVCSSSVGLACRKHLQEAPAGTPVFYAATGVELGAGKTGLLQGLVLLRGSLWLEDACHQQ